MKTPAVTGALQGYWTGPGPPLAGTVDNVVKLPWGDVRGSGAYVVAPGAVHVSGHASAWHPDL